MVDRPRGCGNSHSEFQITILSPFGIQDTGGMPNTNRVRPIPKRSTESDAVFSAAYDLLIHGVLNYTSIYYFPGYYALTYVSSFLVPISLENWRLRYSPYQSVYLEGGRLPWRINTSRQRRRNHIS